MNRRHLHCRTLLGYYPWFPMMLFAFAVAACASVDRTTKTGFESSRQSHYRGLFRACIEQNGGLQMDAIDLYGGRMTSLCSRWAYEQSRKR